MPWTDKFVSHRREIIWFVAGLLAMAVIGYVAGPKVVSEERLSRYLLDHPEFLADRPEVLGAARKTIRGRLLQSEGIERAALIRDQWARFIHASFAPSIGAPDAQFIAIEFTDYTCAPCKASAPILQEMVDANPDLRVAIMFLPVGDAYAEFAARLGYAAYSQNPSRFKTFHHLLMKEAMPLDQKAIMACAAEAGLDVEQLLQDAAREETRNYLENVRQFAEELHLSGVPALVLGKSLLLGGINKTSLSQALEIERSAQGQP